MGALQNLLHQLFNLLGNEEKALAVLGDLAEKMPAFDLRFDDLPAAVDRILDII
jgi:hypothetical protein